MRLDRARPVHPLQRGAVRVLQRQVDVLDQPRRARQRLEQPARDPTGVEVVQPDPARDLGERLERLDQLGQPVAQPEVAAVAGRVLGHQVGLDHPLARQLRQFGPQVRARARAHPAAKGRDRAEGALLIAPLRDLDECRPRRGEPQSRIGRVEQPGRRPGLRRGGRKRGQPRLVLRQRVVDPLDPVEPDQRVELGDLPRQFAAVALDQAAGRHDLPPVAPLLPLHGVDQRLDRLGARLVDEGAGVDHQGVGGVGLGHDFPPLGPQPPQDQLAVDLVLGAAQADQGDAARGGLAAHGYNRWIVLG